MSANIIGSPSRYVQGRDALANVGKYVEKFGDNVLFLVDSFVFPMVKDKIEAGVKDYNVTVHFEIFGGESTEAEVERIIGIAKEKGCGAVAGVGGGKTIDTAKAAGIKSGLKIVVVPTAASTDAPCSSLAVMYTEKGEYMYDLILPQNPDLVLVDTTIIASAPERLLISGMGDAYATWYEAKACNTANVDNFFEGKGTNSSIALAKLCKDILLADGYNARMAVQKKTVTKALENVIEANIYLSGIGFESNGCAIAHSINHGFTQVGMHGCLHGECVAFGTLVQMIMEGDPAEEIEEAYSFYESVGLPTCLADLGAADMPDEKIEAAAKASAEIGIAKNMPFEVTWQMVKDAIIAADYLGTSRK